VANLPAFGYRTLRARNPDYPYTTREPIPGYVPYLDIQMHGSICRRNALDHCENYDIDNIRAETALSF
jgi:hypothetical protein